MGPKLRLRPRTAVIAATLLTLAACAGTQAAAELDYKKVEIPNGPTICFGHASINWWLLQGQLGNISIEGQNLQSSTFRIYEDSGPPFNAQYDVGENVLEYTGSEGPNGMEITDVNVSAGQVDGWNTDNIRWEVTVTDGNGKNHVTGGGM